MKLVLLILGGLLLPTALVVTAAGWPLYGYEKAHALDDRPDAGSTKRHVLGHVKKVWSADKAIDELDLNAQARSLLKQVAKGGEVVQLRECPSIFIYGRRTGVKKGQRVAVSGYVFSAGGKGIMLGSHLFGSLLTGTPQAYDPAAAHLPRCTQCGHPMGWAPREQIWICPHCGFRAPGGAPTA